MEIKNCLTCGQDITNLNSLNKRPNRKYCSIQCRTKNDASKFIGSRFVGKISPGTVGALSELIIASDLIIKKYEVYRALSPSSSCDLLAIKDNKIFTFEVKTAYKTQTGKILYPKKRIKAERVAVVIYSEPKEILYFPEL